MKVIKSLLILQFLFLFIIPIAFGKIIITLPEKDLYNLGDQIIPTISIKVNGAYDGFFNLQISCDEYSRPYDTIQLEDLEAGAWTQLTVRKLRLFELMIGECRLKSNFETSSGEIIDTESSEDFVVTGKVDIIIDHDLEAKPGEDVILLGIVRKRSGELLSKGEVEITFKDTKSKVNVSSFGKFEHIIHLEKDAEAGNIPVLIAVTDKYGNYGNQILNLRVLSVPTRIENNLENNILIPGEILKAQVLLYDHSNKIINGSKVNVKIFGPDEKLIAEKDVQNANYFEFKTEKTQLPGDYVLLSTFEDIKEQSTFEIETVRKIIMNQEGYFVHIENVGNVEYKDKVTIILENDDKKYLINKKINLEAGGKKTIDLSKEVPQGVYDIILPKELVEANNTTSSSNESTQEVTEQTNIIEDVEIDDNRNVIKKTADGMSAVTGAVVGAAGYVASRPTLAAIVLILIVLGTVARYSKNFIISKVKGKKKGDTDHLFEDFKYDEDNKPGN